MKVLPKSFYQRNTKTVARQLLGKVLVRRTRHGEMRAKIVETEAYFGNDDAASHAYKRTSRSEVMFGPAGYAYVYFNYGMYWLFNVVTEKNNVPGAVLIRAVEPVEGIELMLRNRPVDKLTNLTSGPGKLTVAMAVDGNFNGASLRKGDLVITDGRQEKLSVIKTKRVGISVAEDKLLRYYIEDNEWVSRK